jgi:hypothetical protein
MSLIGVAHQVDAFVTRPTARIQRPHNDLSVDGMSLGEGRGARTIR